MNSVKCIPEYPAAFAHPLHLLYGCFVLLVSIHQVFSEENISRLAFNNRRTENEKHIIQQASKGGVKLESTFKNRMSCDRFCIHGARVVGTYYRGE